MEDMRLIYGGSMDSRVGLLIVSMNYTSIV